MSFVHLMCKTTIDNKLGWVAPIEANTDDPSSASLVVPVTSDGGLAKQYSMEVALYKNGEWTRVSDHSILFGNGNGKLSFLIRADIIQFDIINNKCLPYIGRLNHSDFKHDLVELNCSGKDIDDLYHKYNIVLIGCDPFYHYRENNGSLVFPLSK